jgi:hypothetical protein
MCRADIDAVAGGGNLARVTSAAAMHLAADSAFASASRAFCIAVVECAATSISGPTSVPSVSGLPIGSDA